MQKRDIGLHTFYNNITKMPFFMHRVKKKNILNLKGSLNPVYIRYGRYDIDR